MTESYAKSWLNALYLRLEMLLRSMLGIMPNSLLRLLIHFFSMGQADYGVTALMTHDQLIDAIIHGVKYV